MEYQYTINDIQEKVMVSQQALYSLIKKHKTFIDKNSMRKQRRVYYNQDAMNFFISYYLPEEPLEEGKNVERAERPPVRATEAEKSPLEKGDEDRPHESQKAVIDALQSEIESLKTQLETKETERRELLTQNGALILTIQQLQQEKMLCFRRRRKRWAKK